MIHPLPQPLSTDNDSRDEKSHLLNWLYIDFNSFFASCEKQEHPEFQGRPVAVVPMLADSTSCIAACYQAKAYGVKTGTLVRDAKKMCPGLVLVPASHGVYVKYHHKALEAIESCVPIHSVCSIDEICCELTGSQKNLSVATALVNKIKEALKNHLGPQLTVSVGLGPNILLSKMAADMQKPNGLTWIKLSELPEKLYSLKTRDIPGVGHQMEWRLIQNGVSTMKDLLALNEYQMRGIWKSVLGARYYRLLKGENILSDPYNEAQKSIGHQHVLPPKERNFQDALLVLQKLLVKAAVRVRREGFMARKLYVSVRFLDRNRWHNEVSFHETQDSGLLVKHLLKMYRLCPRKSPPVKAAIVLSDFISDKEHQLSFFENLRRSDFYKVVDKINERYGRNTLHIASLNENLDSAPTRIAFSRIPELDEL